MDHMKEMKRIKQWLRIANAKISMMCFHYFLSQKYSKVHEIQCIFTRFSNVIMDFYSQHQKNSIKSYIDSYSQRHASDDNSNKKNIASTREQPEAQLVHN